ncbi:MAG: beta-ketoacyl synthase N-terminal-like domain-containing protein, partial [Candidatus Latescibacteria bacterium]|nr:beta-ketoacyl synthase N-terminal-like domain-containing protein [Candidatus Latescibacterota bacterium]
MDRRVVITGVGVVTPVGTGVPKFWEAIVAGKSGIGLVTAFDTTGYPTQIAGEALDFDPTATIPPKEIRRMDRFAQMAITASLEA